MKTLVIDHAPAHSPHRKRKWYIIGAMVLFIIALFVGARLYLNVWLPRYVNQVLDNLDGYQGSIDGIDIDLYRGAYRVHNLRIIKRTGNIPVPFVAIDVIDLSVQWGALLHGRIVSDVEMVRPAINFALNRTGTEGQNGSSANWNQAIKDLMPIDINLVTFREGKLTYQDFSATPKVNIYIHNMTGEAHNLRNVVDETQTLPSTLILSGDSIGGGKLDMKGKLNILTPVPNMDIEAKLEGVHLPALTDYSNAYAAVDIREGKLSAYSEVIIKDGRVSGYVKPIATDVALIDLKRDANPIKLVWQVLVAAVVEIFTNQPKDQFATKIPLEGNLNDIQGDTWKAVGGIIRNAFVRALQRGIDSEVTYGKAP